MKPPVDAAYADYPVDDTVLLLRLLTKRCNGECLGGDVVTKPAVDQPLFPTGCLFGGSVGGGFGSL